MNHRKSLTTTTWPAKSTALFSFGQSAASGAPLIHAKVKGAAVILRTSNLFMTELSRGKMIYHFGTIVTFESRLRDAFRRSESRVAMEKADNSRHLLALVIEHQYFYETDGADRSNRTKPNRPLRLLSSGCGIHSKKGFTAENLKLNIGY
jgi:hypothetical protein